MTVRLSLELTRGIGDQFIEEVHKGQSLVASTGVVLGRRNDEESIGVRSVRRGQLASARRGCECEASVARES